MPLLIGISGGSGSGKTSFLRELRNAFSTEELCVISQDNYYKPRNTQIPDASGKVNFDLPGCIEEDAFYGDIQQLLNGHSVQRQEYVFNNALATPKVIDMHPAPVIVAEGLFIFYFARIRSLLNVKIFIDAKENLKIIRRIRRDKEERNYPIEDVLYRYEHHVSPAYEKFVLPYKSEADLVIVNNDHFSVGARVVTGFIRNYIRTAR